jgi:GTPase SAR1 family protein
MLTFLSAGQRGAGKTVFLASHAMEQQELHSGTRQGAWMCRDLESQANLNKIRDFVARTGFYPPATFKISNFDLKWLSEATGQQQVDLCWWDLPGETCQLYNPAFLTLVTQVNGIAIFLDAEQIFKMADDAAAIDKTWATELGLLEVLQLNQLSIPIALVVTKGDLLNSDAKKQRLHRGIDYLRRKIDEMGINYRFFYSQIPIVRERDTFRLKPTIAESPLSWLAEQSLPTISSAAAIAEVELPGDRFAPAPNSSKFSLPHRFLALTSVVLSVVLIAAALGLASVLSEKSSVDSPSPSQKGAQNLD